MKCDELKPLVFSISSFAYVDESAVEKNFENPHDHAVYKATEVDAAIAELKDVIHELQVDLEGAKATAYADSVDAGMRERRLRRALWLARALRARDIQRWWIAATCAPTTERACSVWNNVECKCLKKAEQYR